MLWILIKAAVSAVVLWFTYEIGRCSAVHDIYDFKHKRTDILPEDIVCWIKRYDV